MNENEYEELKKLKEEKALTKLIEIVDTKIREMMKEKISQDIIFCEYNSKSLIYCDTEPSLDYSKFGSAWIMHEVVDDMIEEIRNKVLDYYGDNYVQVERFRDDSNKNIVKEGYKINILFENISK